MDSRAFIVTQSVKELSNTLKKAVFNDYGYKLLSDDTPVTIKDMNNFDRHNPDNLGLYNGSVYKIIHANKALGLGLYEDMTLENRRAVQGKAKGFLKQSIIITFSRKMMEYQRTARKRQIERAKNLLSRKDPGEIKKGPNDVKRFMKRVSKTKSDEKDIYSREQRAKWLLKVNLWLTWTYWRLPRGSNTQCHLVSLSARLHIRSLNKFLHFSQKNH